MNIMNFVNVFSPIPVENKKRACFFIFPCLLEVVFPSLTFIWFINSAMRFIFGFFGSNITKLMNFMNFYEGRVFKRFFLNGVFMGVDFMNLKMGFASLMFIKYGGQYV